MATRIRVRKGDTEVEYEGSEQFLRTELSSLLQVVSEFPSGSRGPVPPAATTTSTETTISGTETATTRKKVSGRKSGGGKTPASSAPAPAAPAAPAPSAPAGKTSASPDAKTAPAPGSADIAARIGCQHGTDLVLAASAQLNLRAGQKTFSRGALLAEMKAAQEYYKPVYGKNLSRYLKNLIKDRQLVQRRPNVYGLTAAARREIEKILAE
jgi:hypothetical protein